MTIIEWWCEYDVKAAPAEDKFAGNLTREDVEELSSWLKQKAEEDGAA